MLVDYCHHHQLYRYYHRHRLRSSSFRDHQDQCQHVTILNDHHHSSKSDRKSLSSSKLTTTSSLFSLSSSTKITMDLVLRLSLILFIAMMPTIIYTDSGKSSDNFFPPVYFRSIFLTFLFRSNFMLGDGKKIPFFPLN